MWSKKILMSRINGKGKGKVKGKCTFHPKTVHEDTNGEERCSSTLSLTSALHRGGWSTPPPARFTPGEDPVPIVYEAGCLPGPVWTGAGNLAPNRIRSPDRPSRNESL